MKTFPFTDQSLISLAHDITFGNPQDWTCEDFGAVYCEIANRERLASQEHYDTGEQSFRTSFLALQGNRRIMHGSDHFQVEETPEGVRVEDYVSQSVRILRGNKGWKWEAAD